MTRSNMPYSLHSLVGNLRVVAVVAALECCLGILPAAGEAGECAPSSGEASLPAWPATIVTIRRGLEFTFPGEPGSEYVMYWITDMDASYWHEVGRVFCPSLREVSFFDPETWDKRRFYRVERTTGMVFVPGPGASVDYSFYIGKYEVTNAQFAAFLSTKPSYYGQDWWDEFMFNAKIRKLDSKQRLVYIPLPGWEDHPVTGVPWQMLLPYCNWLSEREGLEKVYDESAGWVPVPDITKDGYRLPMAEEWYKAAAWDPTKDFVGGFWRYGCRSDTIRNTVANFDDGGDPFGEKGWYYTHVWRDPETTPVGYYDGSSHVLYSDGQASYSFVTEDGRSYYGCYDMSGNVAEPAHAHDEPDGLVGMGGSWVDNPYLAAIEQPASAIPLAVRGGTGGFRVARTAVEAAGAD